MDAVIQLENKPLLYKNLLNLKQTEKLDMAVTYFSLIRMDELKFAVLPKIFSFSYLKELHQYIFGDVFEWAGQVVKEKEEKGRIIIEQAKNFDWLRMYLDEKAEKLADLVIKLTKLKPFEIGSFQTTMIYTEMIAKSKGIALDLTYINAKALTIENYIAAENTLCRDRVIEIVKEAITFGMVKENCAENVAEYIKKAGYAPTYDLVEYIKKLNMNLYKFHTITEIYDLYKYPERLGDMDKKIVCDIANGFAQQEVKHISPAYKYKEPEYIQEY